MKPGALPAVRVDRDEALREMGLWPRWRLREAQAGAGAQAASESVAAVAAAEAVVAPDAGAPALEIGAPALAQAAPPPSREARIAALDWNAFAGDVDRCTACGLCRKRQRSVPGVGDREAEWMFVGEAPGAEEDARGEPFVGQAGRLLDNMLASLGLARGRNVYIANVLKCRPPGNRDPEPLEIAACKPYLDRQIELVAPRLIVALGRSAAATLLATDSSIAALRGRVHRYGAVPLVVTYHPAYLLRNLPDKAKAWEDFCFARSALDRLRQGEAAG